MVNISAKTSRQVGTSLRSAAGRVEAQSVKVSPLIPIFIFSLAFPLIFYLGSLRLSPYRLVLIATFIPCLMGWLSQSAGRIRLPDILTLLAAIWPAVVLVHLHGLDEASQPAGISVIETLGTFLFARRYIRDVIAFQRMVRCLALMIIFLLPFAMYESVTGSPVLLKLLGLIFSVPPAAATEVRWGLARAQASFEHPILFGVACSSAFALSWYVFGAAARLGGRLASSLVVLAVFCSLSAGAILSIMAQGILIVWDKITTGVAKRWVILATLTILAFLIVQSVSNRSVIQILISYLTFSSDNAYIRIIIWDYGTQSVMQHPVFGVGLNEWERPLWLGGSIDNFWLNTAVTYGIPGFSCS